MTEAKNEENKAVAKQSGGMLPANAGTGGLGNSGGFTSILKVTYKTSKQFEEEKAKLGDFFIDDQSVGNRINLIPLSYKYKATAFDQGEFKGAIDLPEHPNGDRFVTRPEFIEFQKTYGQYKIDSGLDILVYLTDHNLYGAIFCKGQLHDGAIAILNTNGKNILEVSTLKQTNKKQTLTWFSLVVNDTGKAIGADFFEKEEYTEEKEKYMKETKQIKDDTNETTGSGRAR